jgi:hypothetical protein
MASEHDRAFEIGYAFLKLWEDQAAFNLLFRQPPTDETVMAEQVKDFVVYAESELHELLRTLRWKKHRNKPVSQNRGHTRDEAADVLKCMISLFQIIGLTPETMIEAYWDKTAVVRQRYNEEWKQRLAQPCALVDIDMVLCDYVTGVCNWLHRYATNYVPAVRLQQVLSERLYINAENLGLREEVWKKIKHELRVSGAKRFFPAYQDALPFLNAVRRRGLQIVLLTSRPVDRYPNLYTDTLLWLDRNQLPFDFILWSFDKAEVVLEEGLREHVRLFADDNKHFVDQVAQLGIQVFWVCRDTKATVTADSRPNVHLVGALKQVVDIYDSMMKETETWPQITQTPSTDLTAPTLENPTSLPLPEAPKR